MDEITQTDELEAIETHVKQIQWTVQNLEGHDDLDPDRDITRDRVKRAYDAIHGTDMWGTAPMDEKDDFRQSVRMAYASLSADGSGSDEEADESGRPDTYTMIDDTITEALDAVMGDRDDSHGHPAANHATIAAFWSDYFGIDISETDVAIAFMLAKISRHKNGGPDPDHFRDVAGYAGIANGLEFGEPDMDLDAYDDVDEDRVREIVERVMDERSMASFKRGLR